MKYPYPLVEPLYRRGEEREQESQEIQGTNQTQIDSEVIRHFDQEEIGILSHITNQMHRIRKMIDELRTNEEGILDEETKEKVKLELLEIMSNNTSTLLLLKFYSTPELSGYFSELIKLIEEVDTSDTTLSEYAKNLIEIIKTPNIQQLSESSIDFLNILLNNRLSDFVKKILEIKINDLNLSEIPYYTFSNLGNFISLLENLAREKTNAEFVTKILEKLLLQELDFSELPDNIIIPILNLINTLLLFEQIHSDVIVNILQKLVEIEIFQLSDSVICHFCELLDTLENKKETNLLIELQLYYQSILERLNFSLLSDSSIASLFTLLQTLISKKKINIFVVQNTIKKIVQLKLNKPSSNSANCALFELLETIIENIDLEGEESTTFNIGNFVIEILQSLNFSTFSDNAFISLFRVINSFINNENINISDIDIIINIIIEAIENKLLNLSDLSYYALFYFYELIDSIAIKDQNNRLIQKVKIINLEQLNLFFLDKQKTDRICYLLRKYIRYFPINILDILKEKLELLDLSTRNPNTLYAFFSLLNLLIDYESVEFVTNILSYKIEQLDISSLNHETVFSFFHLLQRLYVSGQSESVNNILRRVNIISNNQSPLSINDIIKYMKGKIRKKISISNLSDEEIELIRQISTKDTNKIYERLLFDFPFDFSLNSAYFSGNRGRIDLRKTGSRSTTILYNNRIIFRNSGISISSIHTYFEAFQSIGEFLSTTNYPELEEQPIKRTYNYGIIYEVFAGMNIYSINELQPALPRAITESIIRQKDFIITSLENLGINHGHPHDRNFCVRFLVEDENGNKKIVFNPYLALQYLPNGCSITPIVILRDWDMAYISK